MHDGEDRRVRTDAECQREHGDRRESGRFQELSIGKPNILSPFGKPFDDAARARLTRDAALIVRAELVRVAEAAHGFSVCVGLAQPKCAQLVDAHREMDAHFVVHVAEHARATLRKPKQTTDAARKSGVSRHVSSPCTRLGEKMCAMRMRGQESADHRLTLADYNDGCRV